MLHSFRLGVVLPKSIPVEAVEYQGYNMSRQFTLGQYRVGTSFNPSANPVVDEIKQKAADLIDAIDRIQITSDPPDAVARLKAVAMTEVESAAMWAVKAATKGNWT